MKRSRTPSDEAPHKSADSAGPGNAVAVEHTVTPPSTPAGRLESARLLLDRGLSREAQTQLTALIKSIQDEQLLAEARCALASALAMEGRFNDSLGVIQIYEPPDARRHLDPQTDIHVRAQLGLAFNYTGDFPKAIALLNEGLRASIDRLTSMRSPAIIRRRR